MNNHLYEKGLQPGQMIENLEIFVAGLLDLAADIGIDVQSFRADHIALRINDAELAREAHQAWLRYGEPISSAMINGRPIIVIEFSQPLSVGSWQVECLELPYPAPGKQYANEGWEHIEFVVPSDKRTAEDYLSDLRKNLPGLEDSWASLAGKGIKTKLSSPKGEGERLANPTVAFKRDGICIKLHPWSLRDVVMSER